MHGPINVQEAVALSGDGNDTISAPCAGNTAAASRRSLGGEGHELFFFTPDVTDAPTLKRVDQFIDHGYRVTVFGFRRDRYNKHYQPPWPHVPLGYTADGRYWQRLLALLRAIPAIFTHRRLLRGASTFYARNIDQLLLALLARAVAFSRAPVTYEVLDIPPILSGRGLTSRFLRAIERMCLRRTRLLVLSSAGFHRCYYLTIQKYRGDWFLAENKLHQPVSRRPISEREPTQGERPWVVGYFGLIRGEATVDLIARLAKRLQGRVLFKFSGVLTTVGQTHFADVLRRSPNVVYDGPYLPQQDLERLYGGVDFAWALDLEHTDHNSRWLMPCRFYEAGYYGVPCLAVRDFEVGNTIEKHRIGWTFDAPLEDSLVRFFERITPADYKDICARLRLMPPSMFVAGDDVAHLCDLLVDRRPVTGLISSAP